MTMPEWAKYRRVDEVIETMPVSSATVRELLEKMPDAYGGEPPGEDSWPEPDSSRDAPYKLSVIWDKLSPEAQEDIASAGIGYI